MKKLTTRNVSADTIESLSVLEHETHRIKKSFKSIFSIVCLIFFLSLTTWASTGITTDVTKHFLVASKARSYQWYHNKQKIDGAINQSLEVKESGYYSVETRNDEGITSAQSTLVMVTAAGTIITVYTVGDSTVQIWNSGYYPKKGWGQVLQYFFNAANVVISDKAVGGTSSKSFYNNYWTAVKNSLKAGDFVFIQFGINDAVKTDPLRYTIPMTTFKDYLTLYVNETKAKGAIPVLVSTLNRNAWNATTPPTVYAAYHDYPIATRQLAATLKVPLIDLDLMCTSLLQSVGPDYSTNFIYMNLAAGDYTNYPSGQADNVHFQEM